ncbi:PREDICTED: U3 small nucleolar RNA-associated protein 15 homolog [Cyphomyrmex costatus]|uniref:U3 small nucleolar RNA-associated protein 15 homolog n=1 Tax=Cyphomyrmex costatus TaxID=456900 RepID=A0A195BZT2_9HYME|nr:PREDICTED: U3 small nucleolar RNA-associated protein 15 homolog [Cyphomyrmex costatus]KYM93436.1 U3 small nucleolar RNA-associated protein 15 like protein [Cyphomyrmex costatus]
MTSFKKINTKVFARTGSELSEDNIYWKKYAPPVLIKEFGPIDYIDFSQVEPHYFATTCSVRVQLYNPITKLATKTYSKFKEAAYGGCFRRDGKLLCVGGEEAVIKLFNISSNSMLRIFSGHKAAVHRVFFTADDIHIASFSDDKTVALWDISSEKQLTSFNEHTDYVRAGAVSPVSPHVLLSGGYDKIVNMYDTRTNKKVFSVNHNAPIESLLFLPTGGIFLSAGGTDIKVWDALAGGKLLAKITQHHKTVTCLKIASNGHRILSGSLDRHVKVYDAGTYRTLHALEYPNAVLSIGISVNDETVVAGMVDGMISVRRREEDVKAVVKPKQKKVSYRHAGENLHVRSIDVVVHQDVKEIMSKHDVCLRKFQYSKALDCVMVNYVVNKTPHVTVALTQELIRREGLRRALTGRDGKSLVNIIKFLNKYIGSIRFGRVLSHVANVLLDIYEDRLDELSEETRKMFAILSQKLQEEEQLILALTQLQGSMQMILSGAETSSLPAIKEIQSLEPSNAAQTEHDIILNIA